MMIGGLISVIVPIYNVQKYLRRCIDLIIRQTYTNLEIILVDDGSLDNSGAICDEYEKIDSRIKVIHKTNGGLSDSRNVGLDTASGEYISFIDADDYISESFLERLLSLLDEHSADAAQCNFIKVYSTDAMYREPAHKKQQLFSGQQMLERMADEDTYIQTVVMWNKLYKRGLWQNLRFEKGKRNEDEFLIHKLLYSIKTAVVTDEILYYYTQRDSSIMGAAISYKNLDYIDALEQQLEFFKQKKIKKLYNQILKRYVFALEELYLKCREYNFSDKDKCLKVIRKKAFSGIFRGHCSMKLLFINILLLLAPSVLTGEALPGTIQRKLNALSFESHFKKACKSKGERKFLLFNTPTHGNLGDQAIACGEIEFFNKECGVTPIEVPDKFCRKICHKYKKLINDNDVIIIHGGGNMGTLWYNEEITIRMIIAAFPNNKIVIMPQSVDYSGDSDDKLIESKQFYDKPNIHICAREQTSYEFMKSAYPKAKVVLTPDIVFYLQRPNVLCGRQGILLCFRNDHEKKLLGDDITAVEQAAAKYGAVTYTDTCDNNTYNHRSRMGAVNSKIREFMSAKLIVTDRLHGMVFAAIAETPCIVLASSNHKVLGVYKWLEHLTYIQFAKNADQAASLMDMPVDEKYIYVEPDNKKLFEKLISFIE